ncbi:mesoderm induction early response protein 1-like isoform X2 [Dreissena polymorpha]|uniref:Mesoderm induction early response protein 1 n=1 Tax=Dreissena polymorpha TaxID=45954 RepID=A0A9D4CX84_DREPO|nr:mesoderm induction early response protein 1-like isoform X2 [Dreissena polymorpha]KAH3734264.1 hypothetical protein DPMN_040703 [Dreissena polymorpha]
MATTGTNETTSSKGSIPDTDKDFDPSADMLVHDYDDEATLEEEENLSGAESVTEELNDLEQEGNMPLEQLLARYGAQTAEEASNNSLDSQGQDTRSSSEEEILSNQDLTLDKEQIARDLLSGSDENEEENADVDELLETVTSSQTARLLRSHSQPGSEDSDSEEDLDYRPEEEWKKTISVGSAYQASVPEGLCVYGDAPAYENEDRLLWDPSRMIDSEVEKYLEEIHLQCLQTAIGVHAVPTGAHVRDDEQALYLLLQCGHNKEEALRRRKMQAIPATDPMSLWSEEECSNFETGLRFYGKDFYMIHQNKVKTRSVGELVQFYYLWKKTERHDIFANKTRLEKRRYTLHPGVTDYMERFLDEQESSAPSLPNRDRSASPVHSLLYGDPKRNHLKPPAHPDPGARGDSEKGSAFQPIHPGVDFNTATTTIPCIMPETPIHKAAEVENIGANNGLPENSYIPPLKKSRLDHSVAEHSVCELDKTDLSLKTNSTEAHLKLIDPIKILSVESQQSKHVDPGVLPISSVGLTGGDLAQTRSAEVSQ